MKKAILAVVLLMLSGCAHYTSVSPVNDAATYSGTGGTVDVVGGVDVYSYGEPARKFKIIAVLNNHMLTSATFNAILGSTIVESSMASKAKELGGDAIILRGSSESGLGVDQNGSMTTSATRKAIVIKYVENEAKVAEQAAGFDSNNKHVGLIVGGWEATEDGPDTYFEAKTTYYPDGKFSGAAIMKKGGKKLIAVVSGEWRVSGDLMTETILSSSIPNIIPVGFTTTSEIVSITDGEFTCKNYTDGKNKTYRRIAAKGGGRNDE